MVEQQDYKYQLLDSTISERKKERRIELKEIFCCTTSKMAYASKKARSVTWPLNGSEAGGDLVLTHTSLLLLCKSNCSYAN